MANSAIISEAILGRLGVGLVHAILPSFPVDGSHPFVNFGAYAITGMGHQHVAHIGRVDVEQQGGEVLHVAFVIDIEQGAGEVEGPTEVIESIIAVIVGDGIPQHLGGPFELGLHQWADEVANVGVVEAGAKLLGGIHFVSPRFRHLHANYIDWHCYGSIP